MSLEDHLEETTKGPGQLLSTHLVIANIAKRPNQLALMTTALAFGVTSIFVVKQPKLDMDPESDSNSMIPRLRQCFVPCDTTAPPAERPPARGQANVYRFDRWRDLVSYLREHQIILVGVEIDERAIRLEDLRNELFRIRHQPPQQQHVAVVMGNEGDGLSATQMEDCQYLLRLAQYGRGTASYNVYVACSLVLQRLHQWQTNLATMAIADADPK
jgi:hypothetical protein